MAAVRAVAGSAAAAWAAAATEAAARAAAATEAATRAEVVTEVGSAVEGSAALRVAMAEAMAGDAGGRGLGHLIAHRRSRRALALHS